MKNVFLAATALGLLTFSSISAKADTEAELKSTDSDTIKLVFNQGFLHFGSFNNAVDQNGTPGMVWGIVVDMASGVEGPGLGDGYPYDAIRFDNALTSLSSSSLQQGIYSSGQWIGDDMVYLTGSSPSFTETIGVGPVVTDSGIGTIDGIKVSNSGESATPYTLDPGKSYSFAVIWFAEDKTFQEAGDNYGYLAVDGFIIPSDEGAGTRGDSFFHIGNNAAKHYANQTFVPEPATYALLIAGMALGGTAVARRRAKLKSA